jgi:hypothetical protein
MRRPHTLIIAIAMIASPILVVTGASTATAATNAPVPVITPAAVLTGQTIHITGDITTPVSRKLDLQYKSGSKWKKVVSSTTDAGGLYAFDQKLTGSKTFRVSAAKASPNAAIVSDSVTVAPIVETASLSIARDTTNGDIADVTGTLTPAIENRPVDLQVQSGSKWNSVTTDSTGTPIALTEDASGSVSTTLDITGAAPFSAKSYRLVAASSDGSTAFTGPAYKFTPGPKTLSTNVIRISVAGGVLPTSKSKEYTGSADIFVNGALTRTESIEKFGVRGSSTAGYDKKPYKLKFDDSFKLFGMADKGKSYTMLASYLDQSFIRDKVGLDLGRAMNNLSWTPNSRSVEVFINGEYRGLYLITESVKIDDKRVDISPLTGMIMETDGSSVADKKLGFLSTHSIAFAFKDPDSYLTPPDDPAEGVTAQKLADIKARTNAFEAKLYSSSADTRDDPLTGYPSFIDVNSAIDFYLVREFTKDNDSDFYRSNYFFWDPDTSSGLPLADNKFHFGPVWDFDRSAGNISDTDSAHKYQSSPQGWYIRGTGTSSGRKNYKTQWFVQLFKDPAFNDAVKARWLVVRQRFADVSTTDPNTFAPADTAADAAAIGVGADNDRARWASTAKRYKAHSTSGTSGYAGEIAYLTKWYHDRYNWMDQQLQPNAEAQLP